MQNDIVLTIVVSALGSTGLFSCLQMLISRKSATTKALQAILRDRLLMLGERYLGIGEMDLHEKDNYTSLYDAYKGVNGNTFVDDLYKDVMNLPLKK